MPGSAPLPSYPALAASSIAAGASSVADALASLPPLVGPAPPVSQCQPGSIASFVGMVQDVWDPELFVLRDASGRTALLAEDISGGTGEGSAPVLAERLPAYLVAPPGLSGWAAMGLGQSQGPVPVRPMSSGGGMKRQREANPPGMDDMQTESSVDDLKVPEQAAPKRPTGPTGSSESMTDAEAGPASNSRACDAPHPGMGLNTPVYTNVACPAVIAKFYDIAQGTSLKVHTLVRVTGVVCASDAGISHGVGNGGDGDGFFADEVAARNPEGIPRLHVLKVEALEGGLGLAEELISNTVTVADARKELTGSAGANVRAEMIRYFGSVLGGDALAAEYLLMNIISRPVQRTDAGTVTGKLSVNIVLPADFSESACAQEIVPALEAVLPAVAHVRVTIPTLNAVDLFPKKDYAANRLRASKLQLPSGCTLIADETGLVDGRLEERGVKNVRALTSASIKALLPVDFQYYDAELLFNANALFVSRPGKSIVPVDVVVRVQPDATAAASLPSWRSATPDALRRMQLAIAVLADRDDFSIPESVGKNVEDSFVSGRRDGAISGSEGQEVLSRWLAVARASARTFGEDHLSEARWKSAVELERSREARNAEFAKAAKAAHSGAGASSKPPVHPSAPLR